MEICESPEFQDGLPLFLYVLYMEGTRWIKVGFAADVTVRLKQLQVGCPRPLRMLYCVETEHAHHREAVLHALFAPYHTQGEWFELPNHIPTVLDLVASITQQVPLDASASHVMSRQGRSPRLPRLDARIVEALADGEPMTLRQLMRRLSMPDVQYAYLRKVMMRLYQQGVVGKVRHGLYCARPRPATEEPSNDAQL